MNQSWVLMRWPRFVVSVMAIGRIEKTSPVDALPRFRELGP